MEHVILRVLTMYLNGKKKCKRGPVEPNISFFQIPDLQNTTLLLDCSEALEGKEGGNKLQTGFSRVVSFNSFF